MTRKRTPPASLEQITQQVSVFLAALDVLMQRPSTPERGQLIALMANRLAMANDSIRFGHLGQDFRKDSAYARRAAAGAAQALEQFEKELAAKKGNG